MDYSLKNKIKITKKFLTDLIAKSWQDAETLQHQSDNIDTSTSVGIEVVKALQSISTAHYVLAGCLEDIADNFNINDSEEAVHVSATVEAEDEPDLTEKESNEISTAPTDENISFEPFEYFVDFDEPSGDPISDTDLYG